MAEENGIQTGQAEGQQALPAVPSLEDTLNNVPAAIDAATAQAARSKPQYLLALCQEY